MQQPRRVVVTGLGLVTSLATGVEQTWQRILAGESGIRTIEKFDVSPFKTKIAGEVLDFNAVDWMDKKSIKRLDPFIHYGMGGARMAWSMAGLPDPLDEQASYRAGCIMGVGLGGLQTLLDTTLQMAKTGPDRVSPFFIPKLIGNMGPGQVAMELSLRGPNLCICTACAAGSHAIGESYRIIQSGVSDIIISGGAEAVISPITLAGFGAARALSTRNDDPAHASRPFDKQRDGFVMSEGAGLLVLEELEHAKARGADILAEIKGYGLSCDAFHMTAPDPECRGTKSCMNMALATAGIKPEQIDYINAHGTSTDMNDMLETKAIKEVFGAHAYKMGISSTKSMIGHMLGAAGGAEAALTVLAIRDQVMPPTINYDYPDPECDLDYVPNHKRPAKIDLALSNSFGFGGTNASLVFGKYTG